MKKLLILLILTAAIPAAADDVYLQNGGKLSGKILDTDPASPTVRVAMSDGITVTLAREQLEPVARAGAADDYEKRRAETPDTVADQLALAQWCKENGLGSRQKIHLMRVLELDPQNVSAHTKLGHVRTVDGKWLTPDEKLADEGTVRRGGNVITTQQAAVIDAKAQAKRDEAAFTKQIATHQKNLGGKKNEEAVAYFNTLISEHAVPGLRKAYDAEQRVPAKKLYINALARIGDSLATTALMIVAVNEPNEDLRFAAIGHLRGKNDKDAVTYLIRRLSPKTSENPQINNAALALGEIGDRTAVPALIGALITEHKFLIQPDTSGQTSATFGSGGGGGLNMGGGAKIAIKSFQNPEVLRALEKLTGVNFQYNVRMWKNWWQNQPST